MRLSTSRMTRWKRILVPLGLLVAAFVPLKELHAQVTITTTSPLPNGIVTVAYQTNVSALPASTSYTWSVVPGSGSLPPGLNLTTTVSGGNALGVISGTPNTAGTYTFTLQVLQGGNQLATRAFSLLIGPTITTDPSLPPGIQGVSYSLTLAAQGGSPPYTWSVPPQGGNNLPNGLSMNQAGTISGTPNAAGTFNFTIRVTDSQNRQSQKEFSLTIAPPLSITTTSLPGGTTGQPYSATLIAAGGSGGYTWSTPAGNLPTGLTLNASTGAITGTPTAAGTSNFTARVTDSGGRTMDRPLSIAVLNPLTITTTSLPDGRVGQPYSQTLAATGGSGTGYTWTILQPGILPAGLSLNASNGAITGTPTTAGQSSFTVRVTDNGGRTADRPLLININPALTITTEALPTGTVNAAYSVQMTATGGVAPLTWSIQGQPPPSALTLNTNGLLSGTPAAAGSFTFRVQVRDNTGVTANKDLTLVVVSPNFGSLSLTNVPSTVDPTQQPQITMSASTAPSSAVPGTLRLTFIPTGAVGSDDPAVQFSNGSRSVGFTVQTNRSVVFANNQTLTLLTGTVAGIVQLTADAQGTMNLLVGSITIRPTIPRFSNISATRTPQGLRVQVTGYSPERRVINVEFAFDVRSGNRTTVQTLTRSAEGEFDNWYRSAPAVPFGSSFLFDQTFAVQGDTTMIQSVTVSLTNGEGKGTSAATMITN
jgi:hypothetical protein